MRKALCLGNEKVWNPLEIRRACAQENHIKGDSKLKLLCLAIQTLNWLWVGHISHFPYRIQVVDSIKMIDNANIK